ncbi:MAG: sensor histidine kinase [Lachnospiraceae bacterium]|nr:sensor histidine kinase [Lachnospiraceae bacterium]
MARNLYFRTNSRHIGQLGRELVTDFVTALVELVKNSYDADAGSVQIKIENANTPNSRIVVIDTGTGMTQEEFEKKWMVIGTSNKVSEPYTPNGRKRTGKKGIGRFSVERLAERVTIYSFTEHEDFKVYINWNRYEEISVEALRQRIRILREGRDVSAAKFIANQLEYYLLLSNTDVQDKRIVEKYADIVDDYTILFSKSVLSELEKVVLPVLEKYEGEEYGIDEIGNPLEQIAGRDGEENYKLLEKLKDREKSIGENDKLTGMVLVLDRLRDDWRQKDIDKLQKELRLLVAPEFIEKDPFHIELIADQFDIPEEMSVNDIFNMRHAKLDAEITNEGKQSVIRYKDNDGNYKEVNSEYEIPLLCGEISFELYYFLRDAAHMKNETYDYRFALRILDTYCGIKIYRDNFRVKPYGDIGNDWLELDSSKVKDTHAYRVGNNQTIGVIKISDSKNPLLIDATNREGIIENQAYEQLKEFILKCISIISNVRLEAFRNSQSELDKAKENRKKQQQKSEKHKRDQDKRFQDTMELMRSGASATVVFSAFERYKRYEELFQKEKEEQYEQTESAYQKVLEFQENELSMYKNLATLGILTGNFGHETQDIISRISNSIAYFEALIPTIGNSHFGNITNILKSDFARIEGYSSMIVEFLRKHKRSVRDNLDFGMVLDNICRLYFSMLQEFGINLSWNSQNNIYYTMRQIDLESIIINMITNAFEQLKGRSHRFISILFSQDEENIILEFEDSGRGVPVNKREEIFQAFVTTKEDGIGLGLNIVKDIVSSYGGTISVSDSERLGGARFLIHLKKKEKK